MPDPARHLLFLGRAPSVEQIDYMIRQYGISHIVAEERSVLAHYLPERQITHIDDVIPCSVEEGLLFDQSQEALHAMMAAARRGESAFGQKYLGLALGDLCEMSISSSLFFLLRRLYVVNRVLTEQPWQKVFLYAPAHKPWFDDIIRAMCAQAGINVHDISSALGEVARPSARSRKLRFTRVLGLAKNAIGTLQKGDDKSSDIARRVRQRRLAKPVLVGFTDHSEYRKTARPVIRETVGAYPIVTLEEEGADAVLDELSARRQLLRTYPIQFSGSFWLKLACIFRFSISYLMSWPKGVFHDLLPTDLPHRDLLSRQISMGFIHTVVEIVDLAGRIDRALTIVDPCLVACASTQLQLTSLTSKLARRRKIKTVYINESLFSENDRAAYVTADYATALDERHRQTIARISRIPPESIRVTGLLPRMIDEHAAPCESAPDYRRRLGIPNGKRIITFALQPLPISYVWQLVSAVAGALTDREDVVLVLKAHPFMPLTHMVAARELTERLSAILDVDGGIVAAIMASEAVIAAVSTVTLQSAVLNKPGIMFNLNGEPQPLRYVDDGIALGASSIAELRECLRQILDGGPLLDGLRESRHRYFAEHLELLDGRGTERISYFLSELAGAARRFDAI